MIVSLIAKAMRKRDIDEDRNFLRLQTKTDNPLKVVPNTIKTGGNTYQNQTEAVCSAYNVRSSTSVSVDGDSLTCIVADVVAVVSLFAIEAFVVASMLNISHILPMLTPW
jgi:hypothetical protein